MKYLAIILISLFVIAVTAYPLDEFEGEGGQGKNLSFKTLRHDAHASALSIFTCIKRSIFENFQCLIVG